MFNANVLQDTIYDDVVPTTGVQSLVLQILMLRQCEILSTERRSVVVSPNNHASYLAHYQHRSSVLWS